MLDGVGAAWTLSASICWVQSLRPHGLLGLRLPPTQEIATLPSGHLFQLRHRRPGHPSLQLQQRHGQPSLPPQRHLDQPSLQRPRLKDYPHCPPDQPTHTRPRHDPIQPKILLKLPVQRNLRKPSQMPNQTKSAILVIIMIVVLPNQTRPFNALMTKVVADMLTVYRLPVKTGQWRKELMPACPPFQRTKKGWLQTPKEFCHYWIIFFTFSLAEM